MTRAAGGALIAKRTSLRTTYSQARHFGSASAQSAAFYNDASVIDTGLIPPADYAPLEAAARRVLARHDALDLVDVLGLGVA